MSSRLRIAPGRRAEPFADGPAALPVVCDSALADGARAASSSKRLMLQSR